MAWYRLTACLIGVKLHNDGQDALLTHAGGCWRGWSPLPDEAFRLVGPAESSSCAGGIRHVLRPPVCGLLGAAVVAAPLRQSQSDYYNCTINKGILSVSGTTGIFSCTRRLVSSSPGASPPSDTQPEYFEGPWHEKYWLLEEYKKKHGNCLVPNSYAIGDVKLGRWVGKQRQLCKKGKLSSNRREMLDALGFSWDPLAEKWERNFALLEQFKEREGHGNAPQSHEEDGEKLGKWVGKQRQFYKTGKLDESYQRRLENLGVSWDPFADQWESNFALLEQFKEREGHVNVPQSHEEDGVGLGLWVANQRARGQLDEERQHRLETIGLCWNPLADQWERTFVLLQQYKEREGNCNVIDSHEEDGVKLGEWLSRQRQLYKKGKIDESYQQRLENLGVSWDPYLDQWGRSFALLEQFKEREGHCNVPQGHEEDGVKLGEWISRQRQLYKKGKIDESYLRRLENLGVSWDPFAEQWERNYGLLEQYKEREGQVDVPADHEEDGIKLGSWLASQRQVRKGRQGILGAVRIERLDNLGIRW